MASSAKFMSSLFLLISFLFIIQIHARESHFFSKVPNVVNNNGEPTTQIPNNYNLDPLKNSEKTQDPNFIPQTGQDTGYGLYGHESGQLPPNSDDNYRENDAVSYKTESDEYYNNFRNGNSKKPYENSFYYNKDLYDNGRQSFQNARLSRDDYATTSSYDNYNGNGRDNNANNVVRQGMSDTRFMEDGKYFYDLNKEPHQYRRSRGNFGNNNNNYYYNGANSYEYGRYNNDEAQFQDQTDQFLP